MFHAMQFLENSIEIDPEHRGGIPVLKGTRLTASQVMAQLASEDRVQDLENNVDLDVAVLARVCGAHCEKRCECR